MNAAPILQTVDLKKHYQQGEHMLRDLFLLTSPAGHYSNTKFFWLLQERSA